MKTEDIFYFKYGDYRKLLYNCSDYWNFVATTTQLQSTIMVCLNILGENIIFHNTVHSNVYITNSL